MLSHSSCAKKKRPKALPAIKKKKKRERERANKGRRKGRRYKEGILLNQDS